MPRRAAFVSAVVCVPRAMALEDGLYFPYRRFPAARFFAVVGADVRAVVSRRGRLVVLPSLFVSSSGASRALCCCRASLRSSSLSRERTTRFRWVWADAFAAWLRDACHLIGHAASGSLVAAKAEGASSRCLFQVKTSAQRKLQPLIPKSRPWCLVGNGPRCTHIAFLLQQRARDSLTGALRKQGFMVN